MGDHDGRLIQGYTYMRKNTRTNTMYICPTKNLTAHNKRGSLTWPNPSCTLIPKDPKYSSVSTAMGAAPTQQNFAASRPRASLILDSTRALAQPWPQGITPDSPYWHAFICAEPTPLAHVAMVFCTPGRRGGGVMECRAEQHSTEQHSREQHSREQHSRKRNIKAQHNTEQHSTA
jgi:hypothetical protein